MEKPKASKGYGLATASLDGAPKSAVSFMATAKGNTGMF